jgi:hypothetical protein
MATTPNAVLNHGKICFHNDLLTYELWITPVKDSLRLASYSLIRVNIVALRSVPSVRNQARSCL